MKHVFRLLVVLPIAVILLLFAIANRHVVTVSLDPFSGNGVGGPSLTAPLFIVLTLTGLVGLLVGGFVAWLRQARWRRAARDARAEVQAARAEADRLRADLLAARAHSALPLSAPSTSTALVPVRPQAA